jgi:hypothetical protein
MAGGRPAPRLDSTLNIVSNEIKYKARVDKQYGVLPPVTCLASQLNQVFMNLLVNAAHALREQGVITIRTGTGRVARRLGLDRGRRQRRRHRAGKPEPHLRALLHHQAGRQRHRLGLSLSYGIVNRHGGRIEVASKVGQGTRFTVHLPVRPQQAAALKDDRAVGVAPHLQQAGLLGFQPLRLQFLRRQAGSAAAGRAQAGAATPAPAARCAPVRPRPTACS